MIEYTDPNPFKQFHIGHLMTNAIGESLARIYEANGATAIRANYQGDVGMHVAKAIYGIQQLGGMPEDTGTLSVRTKFLGTAYVTGAKAYEEDENAKDPIHVINKAVYEKNDTDINTTYTLGRAWSLEHFEELYAILGTKFKHYFFEGEVWQDGVTLVNEYLKKEFLKNLKVLLCTKESKMDSIHVFLLTSKVYQHTKQKIWSYKAKIRTRT